MWQLEIPFFYRDAYKNEVDGIIIDKDKKITALEIKTGSVDLKGIAYFLKKYKVKEAYVLTLDREKEVNNIKIIPFYKYLLR